jgi:hypothetical protein
VDDGPSFPTVATTPPDAAIPTRRKRPVTRAMAQARTRELAVLAGRDSLAVTRADYEQARRELTGETEMNHQEAVFDTPAAAVRENEGGQPALALNPTG